MSLSEGDRVFVNRSQTDWQPIEIVIAKVGRKWAYPLDSRKYWPGTRISVKTLELDGSRAYGRCYLSKEQWQEICEKEAEERAADAAWEDMKRKMREMWQRPAHLDEATIRHALSILFPDVSDTSRAASAALHERRPDPRYPRSTKADL